MKLSDISLDKVNIAISTVKGLMDLKSNIDHLELRKQLVDVESNLVDAKAMILELIEFNTELSSQLAVKAQIIDEPNVECIYIINGGVKVPHCRFCFTETGKLYQLPTDQKREVRCFKCENWFTINAHLPEPTAIIEPGPNYRGFTSDLADMQF